jgi:hypothetical protein
MAILNASDGSAAAFTPNNVTPNNTANAQCINFFMTFFSLFNKRFFRLASCPSRGVAPSNEKVPAFPFSTSSMTAVFSTVFLEEQKKNQNFSSERTEETKATKGTKKTDFFNFFDFFSWNRLTALKLMLC